MTDRVSSMDSARRAAIRARCENATPGEWWGESGIIHAPAWQPDAQPYAACHVAVCHYGKDPHADSRFIAHARADVPDLLAALDAAEQENARLWRIVRQIVAQEPRDNELGTCACCGSDAGSWRQHDADCAYALACAALQEATDAPGH